MRRVIRVVRPALLLVVVLPSFTSSLASPCKTLNLMSKDAAELDALYTEATGKDANVDWLRRARACSIGRFVVYGPADGASHNLYVTLDDNPVASISPDGFLLFEGTGRLVASLSDRDGDGRFDWLDYQGREAGSGNDVAAIDSNLDGKTDMITISESDGSKRRLLNIEGEWLERVTREGETGFIIDGEFVVGDRESTAARLRTLRRR